MGLVFTTGYTSLVLLYLLPTYTTYRPLVKLIFNYVSWEVTLHVHVIQFRFGMICHVCDVGWSVVYDGKYVNVTGDARHDR